MVYTNSIIRSKQIEAYLHPKYKLLRIIKTCDGCTISTAQLATTGLKVIVKSEDKETIPNWWKEVAILSRIRHPNVVKVLDVYESDYHVHIVQEYCSKGSLLGEVHKANEGRARSVSFDTSGTLPTAVASTRSVETFTGVSHKKSKSCKGSTILYENCKKRLKQENVLNTCKPRGEQASSSIESVLPDPFRKDSVINFALLIQAVRLEKTLASYLMQIAFAIRFLHTNGIVHGDIKLENIAITPNGTAKLIDFGMASDTSARRSSLLFNGHDIPEGGTLGYIAPECMTTFVCEENSKAVVSLGSESANVFDFQSTISCGSLVGAFVNGGSKETLAVDVWAFGVVLYSSFVGKKPWTCAKSSDPQFRRFSKYGFEDSDFELLSSKLRTMICRMLNVTVSRRWSMEDCVQCMVDMWGYTNVPDESYARVYKADGPYIGELILEGSRKVLQSWTS
eukprot:CFRG4971T1